MDWDDVDDRMAAWLKQGDHAQTTVARVCLLFGALRGFPANACVAYAMWESKLSESDVTQVYAELSIDEMIRLDTSNGHGPFCLYTRHEGNVALREVLYPSTESESDA